MGFKKRFKKRSFRRKRPFRKGKKRMTFTKKVMKVVHRAEQTQRFYEQINASV
jgi:hypothetical protein